MNLSRDGKMLKRYKLDNKGTGHVFKRKKLYCSENSKYQKIEVSELNILGKVLALDDILQLSSLDCDRYHETFAHVPASNLECLTTALVLGGGDLILAKELLKYDTAQIDLVDIDERVLDIAKLYLSDLNDCAFSNKRLNIICGDAAAFCENTNKKYDIIYGDITDPHPDSPSSSLVGLDMLKTYKSLLKPGGIFVCQTDNIQIASGYNDEIKNKCAQLYKNVGSFAISSLTLSSIFSFVWGSDSIIIKNSNLEVETNWLNKDRFDFVLNLLNLH
jgi:spermidine synthase